MVFLARGHHCMYRHASNYHQGSFVLDLVLMSSEQSGAIALVVLICMRETHAPTILKAKTARLRKERNNPLLRAAGSLQESASQTFKRAIVRPFKMMTMSPITLSLALYAFVLCISKFTVH